jgi:lipoprotein-releasing system permease protein
MSHEQFIALRYLRSKRQMRFINIIMLVSVIGITVGVAALIIVLSVFNGFNSVVTHVLVGFDPHIRIEASRGRAFGMSETLERQLRDDPRIVASAPYVSSKALLMTSRVNRVVLVKGVIDSTIGEVSGVKQSIVLGNLSFQDSPDLGGIVLGLTLADRMGATVGSELTVVSPVGVDAMVTQLAQPLMRRCRVVGIYDSRNKDYDAHYAFVSLETARQLFQMPQQVSGVEVRLRSIDDAEALQHKLEPMLGDGYRVSTWYDLHRDLYSVMKVERWTAYIILCLIVGVATFNVLGSLTMGVVEKRRDIGILKALGATRNSIIRVFMFEGVLVGAIGTVLGVVLGLLVCYLQIQYHLFPLDPTVYIIPAIPVEVRWTDFVAVGLASMILCTLASLYPARRAAQLFPVEAIRWE